MRSSRYVVSVSIVALIAGATTVLFVQYHALHSLSARKFVSRNHPGHIDVQNARGTSLAGALSVPLTFEPMPSDWSGSAQFVGRSKGMEVALTRDGLAFAVPHGTKHGAATASLRFGSGLVWRGLDKVRAESDYFIGTDPRKWRTHVPHFARAETAVNGIELVAYGNADGLEYDLRLRPGDDPSRIHLRLIGGEDLRLDRDGNLEMRVGATELRMRAPAIYEVRETKREIRRGASATSEPQRRVDGGYALHSDGTIGFRAVRHDAQAALVIDPSISLVYSSFLGGAGSETAASVAVDSAGKIYVGGTTTSPASFPETTPAPTQLGPGTASSSGSPPEYFIAKIDPTQSGANSLIYLTFLGGSATQAGGLIAVDSKGDVAVTGTTTSTDFPVTDQSKPTSGLTNGGNDTTVSEIDPSGSKVLYSTLLGGNGSESTEGAGGIALDSAGNIFIASDTNSTNLPVTSNAYTQTYLSSTTNDGFIAKFQMGTTPSLAYCTYLGLDGETGVGGIAVDANENAYVTGFTSDPNADFPATPNAIQSSYGGGAFDAFVMKISTSASGSALGYATLLGGSGSDQAFAIALDGQDRPSAYVTGTTSSRNFPTNGTVAAYQPNLPSNATGQTSDAFLSVIAQSLSGTSVTTSLAYSTYLGGSELDSGESLAISAPNAVYVGGTANSWDFPWRDNLQPFNGYGDAFVAKLDPTSAGAASLIYATPLGGTSPAGVKAGATGNSIALGATGTVWLAGQTTSADFPAAGNAGNGFQQICTSCQQSPVLADAFVAEIQENDVQQLPSLYFAGPSIPMNFGKQPIGSVNIPPQFAAIKNGGEAPLSISGLGITGPNSGDFSLSNATSCASGTIAPGNICSFEVSFIPSVVGSEGAFVQVTSDAPGSPQVLEVFGEGTGLVALPASLSFGSQLTNTTSNPLTVTLTNTTNESLQIISLQEQGANPGAFPAAIQANLCQAGTALQGGDSCPISYDFAPTSSGSFQAEVDISYQVQGLTGQTQMIPLSGVGLPPAPVASLQPPALIFGTISVGSTGQVQVVTLTNTGSAALNLTSISVTGANAADFTIVTEGNSPCPASSGSLPTKAACTVGVQFAPKSAGSKSASLALTDNAAGSPQIIALSGTAQLLAIQVSPASLNFQDQSVGTTSTAQQITLTNSGTAALTINGVSATGTNAADFKPMWRCLTLAPNANCPVSVTFSAKATGPRSAIVNISDDAPNSPQTVSVSGIGTQAAVTLAPTGPVHFGNQAAGTASAATTITVSDSGTGALAITQVSFGGANAADFSETDNCNSNVAPAGNCTIQVTFKPACGNNQAARSATLTLTDNAPNSPQNVALSGTATGDMCFAAASGGSTSATVSAGATATYSLDVSAASGYTGKVTLACSDAPQNSTCTMNPASVSVAGSTMVPFAVNVATTAGSGAVVRLTPAPPAATRFRLDVVRPSFFAIVCLGFILACVCERKSQLSKRWLAAGLLFGIVVIAAAAGCGSSGGDPGVVTDPGTPQGTYKLAVTGTASDGTSQSIQLTLTVD